MIKHTHTLKHFPCNISIIFTHSLYFFFSPFFDSNVGTNWKFSFTRLEVVKFSFFLWVLFFKQMLPRSIFCFTRKQNKSTKKGKKLIWNHDRNRSRPWHCVWWVQAQFIHRICKSVSFSLSLSLPNTFSFVLFCPLSCLEYFKVLLFNILFFPSLSLSLSLPERQRGVIQTSIQTYDRQVLLTGFTRTLSGFAFHSRKLPKFDRLLSK